MKFRVLVIALVITLGFIMQWTYSKSPPVMADPINVENWIVKAYAEPNSYLLFAYVDKDGIPACLKAIMVFENKTHYRLIGGVGVHKDLVKTKTFGLLIVAVGYNERIY